MFNLFGGKKLESVLGATKIVKVHGVRFTIQKINVLHYLDGSKAVTQSYDLYKSGIKTTPIDFSDKKILEHFQHVLYSGIVNPKLSLIKEKEGLFIEFLFTDLDLVFSLYSEIMQFTNGKKKTT